MAAVGESSKEQEQCSSSEGLREPKELTFKSLVSDPFNGRSGMCSLKCHCHSVLSPSPSRVRCRV